MAPGNDLLQRRLGREMTMFETRNAALGGSKTADNLADADALGIDPSPGARLPDQARQKGFFDFAGDVAPREANVVQVPVGPSGEFLTVLVALPPDVQGLA